MSTGKNILMMSALVSKCDLTLEVLNSETPDARDKGDRTEVLYCLMERTLQAPNQEEGWEV